MPQRVQEEAEGGLPSKGEGKEEGTTAITHWFMIARSLHRASTNNGR
jgi:hypothetical protein